MVNLFIFLDETSLNDSEKIKNYRSLYNEILLDELEKGCSGKDTSFLNNAYLNNSKFDKNCSIKQNISFWLNTCSSKLKELNSEHAKILAEYKNFIQFPDLYAELYNL